MADVFLSYRNTPSRRAIVRRLATVLRAHDLKVWWDHSLESGEQYEERIYRELHDAHVIAPLWCTESVASRWVHDEARVGLRRGVLSPILLQQIDPPKEFEKIHAHSLIGWNGDIDARQIRDFVVSINQKVGRSFLPPADLLEELKHLPSIEALESTREIVQGESFTVYSNYELFGNPSHAAILSKSAHSIDLMGIALMSFHREEDEPLGATIRKRAEDGVIIRALVVDPENTGGLANIIRNPDVTLPAVRQDIERSLQFWSELAQGHPNVECRRVRHAIIRHIATITLDETVATPYWYAANTSRDRPTLVCKANSVFYKLLKAEFDALWGISEQR